MTGAIMNCGAMQHDAYSNPRKEKEFNTWFRNIVRVFHTEGVHFAIIQDRWTMISPS